MKKIFTLFFAVVLVSAAAFAQDGRSRHNKNNTDNFYHQQYQSENGYAYSNPYDNDHDKGRYGDVYDNNSNRRTWDENYRERGNRDDNNMMMYRDRNHDRSSDDRRFHDNFNSNRNGLNFRITIGGRRFRF